MGAPDECPYGVTVDCLPPVDRSLLLLAQTANRSLGVDTPCSCGTELKSLLKDWLGIESTPTCSCNAMANKMNRLGVEWSESADGLAEILAVMKREHGRRKSILPWSDTAASMLVRLACRRARANQ